MSFDTSSKNLCDELQASLLNRDDLLGNYDDERLSIPGPFYRTTSSHLPADLENHAYEWLSMILPKVSSGEPIVRVSSVRPGEAQQKALAQQHALNRWGKLIDIKRTNRRLAVDLAFRWMVAVVYPTRQPGIHDSDDPPTWPTVARLSPKFFTWDALAQTDEECRFKAHLMIRDKKDIQEEAKKHPEKGWDAEVLEKLTTDGWQSGDYQGASWLQVKRGEIAWWEVWVPEEQLEGSSAEKGHFGSWHSISLDFPEKPVRKPRPYFGHRSGPYMVRSGLEMPDEATGVAPLVATKAQQIELNALARSMSASIRDFKQILVTTDPKLASLIQNGEHQFVYPIDATTLKEALMAVPIAGMDPQQLAGFQLFRDRLDRLTGLGNPERGAVTGEGTATEIIRAGLATENRVSDFSGVFAGGQADIYRKAAFYIEFDEDTKIRLGKKSSMIFLDVKGNKIPNPVVGGSAPNKPDLVDFEANEYEIDVDSLAPKGEAKAKENQQELLLLADIGQRMPTAPWMNWEDWARRWDENSKLKAAEGMFDFEMARQVGALMLQQGSLPAPQQSAQPQPRIGKDTPSITVGAGGRSPAKPGGLQGTSAILAAGNGKTQGPANGKTFPAR